MSTWCLKLLYLSLKIIVVYALSACEALEDTTMVSIIVYRRRTDNTIDKRKSTKGKTTIYKTYIEN